MPTSHTRLLLATTFALIMVAPGHATSDALGGPLRGLSPDELQRFTDGRTAFESVETAADGLGPVFNGTSCAGCHSVGGTGGGSETLETRFGTMSGGVFDPMASHGGSLIQTDGIGAAGACDFVGEKVPGDANVVAGRRTTPLFGLGLVDALPDGALIALANMQARRSPETAGRPNMVTDVETGELVVGRFGWKSQVPSLFQFSGDAYLNEMGITTPMFPDENCPQGDCASLACDPVPGVDDDMEDVELFRDFMIFLAPANPVVGYRPYHGHGSRYFAGPGRPSYPHGPYRGDGVFAQIGCADCHVSSLKTGPSAATALRYRRFQPYSDFLLHDMGSLGDGVEQGVATGREMRTAPLWGLRLITTFLHDGRAHTIEDAILAHDGQGSRARDRFTALSAGQKTALLAFLGGL